MTPQRHFPEFPDNPAVVYAFLRYRGDFARTVESVILLGGDADTTGALAGALAGLDCGAAAIPPRWIEGIIDSLDGLWASARKGRLSFLDLLFLVSASSRAQKSGARAWLLVGWGLAHE